MSELKTQKNNKNVIDFLNTIENEQRKSDCLYLLEMFGQISGEKPFMWGDNIVGFGSYHYKSKSGQEGDWFPIGFSPRKQKLVIYIIAGFNEFQEILQDMGKFKTSVSCLYINKLSDINIEKLKLLVESALKYMKEKYK